MDPIESIHRLIAQRDEWREKAEQAIEERDEYRRQASGYKLLYEEERGGRRRMVEVGFAVIGAGAILTGLIFLVADLIQ